MFMQGQTGNNKGLNRKRREVALRSLKSKFVSMFSKIDLLDIKFLPLMQKLK